MDDLRLYDGAVLNSYFEEQEKGQSQSGDEYDEYQFAKRQLSETGEAYDEVLTGGRLAFNSEGFYTVEAQDESAICLIDDLEMTLKIRIRQL